MADAPEPAPTAGASRRIDSDVPEPRLNYRRLEAGVQELLQDHHLTAICVSDKVLALGTQQGSVHILDPVAGTEVRRFQDHRGAVLDLSFDASVEVCASSSEDGTVRVRGIFSDESFEGRYNKPVQAVALDPRYASRKTKEFVAGTAAGQLCLASQGWLGKKDVVLHSGEGSQLALAWSGPLIAFATEVGVRIYDTSVHRRIAFLPRPREPVTTPPPPPPDRGADSAAARTEPAADASLATSCQLHWGDVTLLYIAWPWAVQVARVMVQQEVLQGPGLQQGSYNASREMQLVASASTEFAVAGIAPFGPDIAVLGYPAAAQPAVRLFTPPPLARGKKDTLKEFMPGQSMQLREGVAQNAPEEAAADAVEPRHVEMCVVSRAGEMLASHPVPLHSTGPAGAGACRLACWCMAADALRILDAAVDGSGGCSSSRAQPGSVEEQQPAPAAAPVSKWWREGLEPQYYVMAGKELLVGRPLDVEERLAWLTDHHAWQRALAVLDTEPASISAACREKVVQRYLEHLVGAEKKYELAAANMPKLLRDNAALWERWVGEFANCRQLPLLAQYLPTASPRLAATAYDMVLRSFLPFEANHGALLQVVSSWPSSLYSVKLLIDRVTARLRMMTPQDGQAGGLLKEVLARLYQLEGRPDLAMNILLKLGRRDVFEFIERFHLHHHLRTKVVLLMRIDEEQAVAMLVAHHDLVPPSVVVAALQQQMAAAEQQATSIEAGIWHFRLFRYLHELFRRAPFAAPSHHSLQVKLYADYSPKDLMNFLVTSQSYQLEHALEVCRSHKLVSEQVYILGRMGSSEKAVRLIITQLRDVAQAVAFVAQQDDPELWALLISLAVTDPEMAGQLLDHVGLHINPELVLKRIPEDMGIPRLRSRLAKILADMKSGIALRQGCSNVLMSDSISLSAHLYSAARRRFPRLYLFMDAPSPAAAAGDAGPAEAGSPMAASNGCQWFMFNGQPAAPSVIPTRPPALLSPCVHVRAAAAALGPQLAEPGMDGTDVPESWRPGPEAVDGVVVGLELEEGDDSLSDAASIASAAAATPPIAASHGCASTSPGRRLGTPGRGPHDVHDGLRQGRGLHGSGGSSHGKRPLAPLITP